MKRLICLFLAVLFLCGCGAEETPETTGTAPVEKAVTTPLTWADIDAIPIANDSNTGILDNTEIDRQTLSHLLGNHCTSSPYWAWSRVINSVPQYANANMTKSYGFLPVGDYVYDTVQWSEVNQTKAVCKENGEQRMYETYALLKPADCQYKLKERITPCGTILRLWRA